MKERERKRERESKREKREKKERGWCKRNIAIGIGSKKEEVKRVI